MRLKIIKGIFAWAVLFAGVVASIHAAKWLKSTLELPSYLVTERGSTSDLTEVVIALVLFIGYLAVTPKLLGIRSENFIRMLTAQDNQP